jgi:hypothetical protein
MRLKTEEENVMRTVLKSTITGTLAILFLGMIFVSNAAAQCGIPSIAGAIQPQSWQGAPESRRAEVLLVSDKEGANHRIVGFWKFKFVLPDGTVIDNGFVQWHSDGTEITNSSRPPATGNFCLGVWEKSGPSSYQLNHFALSWDLNGNLIGPAQIREDVTLNHKADQYEGTFTIDQYDVSGNPLAHVAGTVTATRITVDTPVGEVL